MNLNVEFSSLPLPALSVLGFEPKLHTRVYEDRIQMLRDRMEAEQLEAVVVYADREHPGNASYLTGFDPRFEEAFIVVLPSGPLRIVAGNESLAIIGDSGLDVVGVLCQSLSLPGQPRETRRRLSDALREAGVTGRRPVGVIGWRLIPEEDAPLSPHRLAVPLFLVDEIAAVAKSGIVDATHLLLGLGGLRARNGADQLALNEHRATRASQHVWRAIEHLRPGISELELSKEMNLTGLPLSAHPMLTSGRDSVNGLRSPGDRLIEEGDRFSIGLGLWGGLSCRAGIVARFGAGVISHAQMDFVAGYWSAVRSWYEHLHIGVSSALVARKTTEQLALHGIRPALNPGHLQHIDEWLDSPFSRGSTFTLESGLSLQADIIPVGADSGLIANVEDALAIANEELRDELAERYPEAWARIRGRREFMAEMLGIDLADEVLPFSDRQAVLPPGLLSPDVVCHSQMTEWVVA